MVLCASLVNNTSTCLEFSYNKLYLILLVYCPI